MYTLAVLLVSVVPAIAFLVVILRMDRREPEPLLLVVKVIGLGAAAGIVAALVELGLDRIPVFHAEGLAGAAAASFLQIAPVEELCKLAVVLLFVWKNPNFNEENDGIVYLGASAIGFALLENIAYVIDTGIGTGILRAFTAIPLHVFTAVVLGLFVGRAHFSTRSQTRNGLIAAGFMIAWLIHGTYDTLALSGSALALLLLPLVGGLAAFGVIALRRGRRLSLLRWGPDAASTPAMVAARAEVAAPGEVATPAKVAAPAEIAEPAQRPRRLWMAIISRTLLAACGGFWLLIFIGLASTDSRGDAGSAVLGAILITFIPAGVGVLLEVAHHRHRRPA
jgi:RsiW-degrading membrane proteinase PrsW (M82 family)